MADFEGVQILEGQHNLSAVEADNVFGKAGGGGPDVGKELAALHVVHDQIEIVLVLKGRKERTQKGMADCAQHLPLRPHVLLLLELHDALLAHNLHAVVGPRRPMATQLGHSKRPRPNPRQHVVLRQLPGHFLVHLFYIVLGVLLERRFVQLTPQPRHLLADIRDFVQIILRSHPSENKAKRQKELAASTHHAVGQPTAHEPI